MKKKISTCEIKKYFNTHNDIDIITEITISAKNISSNYRQQKVLL